MADNLIALCESPIGPKPFRVDLLGTYLDVDAAEIRDDGKTWVRLTDTADIAGWDVIYRADLNKVFVKPKE